MHEQSHAGLGFDVALYSAIQKSSCLPAINHYGVPITVVAQYRCVFKQGHAAINSTSAIQSKIVQKN